MTSRRLTLLEESGVEFVAGVPCAALQQFFAACRSLPPTSFLPAVREEHAVAACAGAWLGGRRSAAAMGTAGLAGCLDVLSCLHASYGVPLAIVAGLRLDTGGAEVTPDRDRISRLLDVFGIPWREASVGSEADDNDWLVGTVDAEGGPAVLLVGPGADS